MNGNARIAGELVRIARELAASSASVSRLEKDIERELGNVKDERLRQDIENLISARIASDDWKGQVKNWIRRIGSHGATIELLASVIALVILEHSPIGRQIVMVSPDERNITEWIGIIVGAIGSFVTGKILYGVVAKLFETVTGKKIKREVLEQAIG